MEQSGVAIFTRLLPLSIRKDGGGGMFQRNGIPSPTDRGISQHHQQQQRDPGAPHAINMYNSGHLDNFGGNSSPPTSHSTRTTTEQKEIVRVTLTYPSPTIGAMNPHKEISMRITNDENPMFFYHLRITESDYPIIKSQQGLLVDFYGFPNQLITLLEKCDPNTVSDSEDSSKNSGNGPTGPRFIMVMKVGISAVLDFVESNPFKYLCHLSLHINPGSDTEVKKYLADVTSGLKKDCSLLNEKYSHLSSAMENEVKRLKNMIEQKNQELRELKEELHSQANSLSTKHFQDMTVEKEKLLKLQSELASKFEAERLEVDRRHSQGTASLEKRIATLEAENRDLIQIKFKNETTLQAYSTKVKNLEDDLKLLQQEITLTKKQNEKLDHDYHEKQRLLNSLQNRVSLLEADLREKQNTMQRQHDQIGQVSEQKKFLEDRATEMVKEVEKLKGINKSVSGELIKANEIIRKLQDDLRSLHTKTKLQNQITVEQERRISEHEKLVQQQEETISHLKTSMSTLEENEKKAQQELEESLTKIEELETTVKSNENMISWLNKQLNEFQGLGNLNRFRQNLASAGGQTGSSSLPPGASSMYPHRPSTQQQDSTPGQANNSTAAVNGSLRTGGLFSSIQNTLPNGTPSWMNIYQSTSTPLDNDLSSRFERVNVGNHNYSLGRSRLDTISEKTRETNFTAQSHQVTGDDAQNHDEENRNPNNTSSLATTKGTTATTNGNKTAKPPTWAKPRSGKVTLGENALNKSNPVWRNK